MTYAQLKTDISRRIVRYTSTVMQRSNLTQAGPRVPDRTAALGQQVTSAPPKRRGTLAGPALQRGFTIVELLIVIVVIGILAAITIVAFTGIQNRAAASTLQSDLRQAGTQLGIEQTDDGSYPQDDGSNGYPSGSTPLLQSSGTNYQYTSDGSSYCLTATSDRSGVPAYYISSSAGGVQEVHGTNSCPGHAGSTGGSSGSEVATAESCFDFNASWRRIINYYDNEDNNPANPACPRDVVIPSEIDGVAVMTLGSSSFYVNNLTSVTIPDSVTSIQGGAFHGNNLTSVTIPNSVKVIGQSAFWHNNLTSVTIPNSVTLIEGYAFNDNNLTSVTIPDSVTYIGNDAFGNNTSLTTASLKTGTTLGTNTFPSSTTITWR